MHAIDTTATEIAILSESLTHLRAQIDAWLAVLGDAETPDDQRPAIDTHVAWLRVAAETKRGRLAWLRREAADAH
jgi:hypothetical protein